MNMQPPSCALVIVLIATQVLGPAALWAAEQGGGRVDATNRVVISAISDEQLTAQSTSGTKTLHFGDTVDAGDQISTGDRTVAEVLIGNRAVLTLRPSTTVELTTVSPEQTTIQVTQGIVRVAASAAGLGEQGRLLIQTPTGQVQTRGGIVRVMVNTPVGSAEQAQAREAKPYLTSYAPNPMVAAIDTRGDIIQVEEGTAQIAGAGPDGAALTVQAGQSVTRQAGQAGSMSALATSGDMRAGVLASADHTKTPKEGVEYLVALQVDQATALGHALTGEAKTVQDEAAKDDAQNAIIGPTGGLNNTLFGGGNNPTESTGSGFGVHFSDGIRTANAAISDLPVNGGANALLIFTRKDPVEPFVNQDIIITPEDQMGFPFVFVEEGTYLKDSLCDSNCVSFLFNAGLQELQEGNDKPKKWYERGITLKPTPSITSQFTVVKELVLVGGTPNVGHEGVAPKETLIVRGAAPLALVPGFDSEGQRNQAPEKALADFRNVAVTGPTDFNRNGNGLFPSDAEPVELQSDQESPKALTAANSNFVVQSPPQQPEGDDGPVVGGTLSQFSNRPDSLVLAFFSPQGPFVDGAITATGSNVVLTGGVTLDQGTQATIGETIGTKNYFEGINSLDFNGSLLAVIKEPTGFTSLTVQDRLLGVYDGSKIDTDGDGKALLSILDAQLKGPSSGVPLIDIDAATHFKGDVVKLDSPPQATDEPGSKPNVIVTSAVVTRSTMQLGGDLNNGDGTLKLDHALLEASAPLLALTKAMMTTKSHFADLAGNKAQSIRLDDALVALNASELIINGNLLNLNNATATVNGYLFSLNASSTLTIMDGSLFSLNNRSSLNLGSSSNPINAFGVFGSGNNTLNITNDLCKANTCGTLVNSANVPFMVNGSALQVAGVPQDVNVKLPPNFNDFAGNPARTVNISADAALFHVDNTSTLTINDTPVVPVKQ